MPWTDEQVGILAQVGTRLINSALAAVYPTRSLDAIKGLRRQARYRFMLAEESAQLAPPSPTPSDEQVAPSGTESEGSEKAVDASVGQPAQELLSSFGLHDTGLATNLTEVPLTMSDLSTLYNHFGIRPSKPKPKSQAA
ncbi:hypothetical protein MTO96_043154 [Rhipicephalus appendiculatus]